MSDWFKNDIKKAKEAETAADANPDANPDSSSNARFVDHRRVSNLNPESIVRKVPTPVKATVGAGLLSAPFWGQRGNAVGQIGNAVGSTFGGLLKAVGDMF